MIYSMTGYANKTVRINEFTFEIDIRSVNQKFCDLNIKYADELKHLDTRLRELLVRKIPRGKIDLRIYYQNTNQQNLKLDTALLTQYLNIVEEIKKQIPNIRFDSAADILNLPNIMISDELNISLIETDLLQKIDDLIDELANCQSIEGNKLKSILHHKVNKIISMIDQANLMLPTVKQDYQLKLKQKLSEILDESSINDQRFSQEFAFFCQKIDVDEELTRLHSHCTRFQQVLETGGFVGKQLDFISQEMHREANTFGAKSSSFNTSNLAIELKVLIDQIREQVQNIM